MVLASDMMVPSGPPPSAILAQRCWWHLLMVLLFSTLVLRLLGLDVAGALLTGLMLVFAVIMTRDGMSEMPKYVMVFSVLCGLNFFFDILPLLTEFGGRVMRYTTPGKTMTAHNIEQTTYTLTIKTTDFFDWGQGFVYNIQSVSMILSPICMGLGCWLSITAQNEIQRLAPNLWDDDGLGVGGMVLPARDFDGAPRTGAGPGRGNTTPGRGGSSSQAQQATSFERFQGTGHKLSNED